MSTVTTIFTLQFGPLEGLELVDPASHNEMNRNMNFAILLVETLGKCFARTLDSGSSRTILLVVFYPYTTLIPPLVQKYPKKVG